MEKIGGRLGRNLMQYFPITFIHQEVAFYFFPLREMNRNSRLPAGVHGFSWINRGSLLGLCQFKQLCVL